MFNFFSAVLDKMGNWFGIVFKIVLPAIVMYRPVKMLSLSVLVFGTALGGNADSFNNLGIIIFYLLYAILALMLFLFPKVASAMEFALIAYYFACLVAFYFADFFVSNFEGIQSIVLTYARALPLVVIFLVGKILFFIFIKANREKFEANRSKKFKRF